MMPQPQMQGPLVGQEAAQKEEQKRLRRLEKRELRRVQKQSDSNNAVKWLVGFGVMNALLIMVPLFGNSWNHTMLTGTGAKLIQIRTSMMTVEVELDCGKNFLEDKLCNVAKKMDGTHSLSKARALACGISTHACQTMGEIYGTSFIIFFSFILAALSYIAGASFLYYYWFESPLPVARRWALAFYLTAPISSLMGLVAWSAVTPGLHEIARGWTYADALVSSAINLGEFKLFGFNEASMFPFGWCWFWSIVSIFISLVTLMLWPCFFSQHEGEEGAVEAEEALKDYVENVGLDGYGADGLPREAPGQVGSSYDSTAYGSAGLSSGQLASSYASAGASYGGGSQQAYSGGPQQHYIGSTAPQQAAYGGSQQAYGGGPPQHFIGSGASYAAGGSQQSYSAHGSQEATYSAGGFQQPYGGGGSQQPYGGPQQPYGGQSGGGGGGYGGGGQY